MKVSELHYKLKRLKEQGHGNTEVLCWRPVGMMWMDVTKVELNHDHSALLIDGQWFDDDAEDELQETQLPDESD